MKRALLLAAFCWLGHAMTAQNCACTDIYTKIDSTGGGIITPSMIVTNPAECDPSQFTVELMDASGERLRDENGELLPLDSFRCNHVGENLMASLIDTEVFCMVNVSIEDKTAPSCNALPDITLQCDESTDPMMIRRDTLVFAPGEIGIGTTGPNQRYRASSTSNQSGRIIDVSLYIDAQFDDLSGLAISLFAPDGNFYRMINQNPGCTGDDLNVTFNASGDPFDCAALMGTIQPEIGDLTALFGSDKLGTWELAATDYNGMPFGFMDSASLIITYDLMPQSSDNCMPSTTFSDDVSGLNKCHIGSLLRTFTVTDPGGRTASCSQTITLENDDEPALTIDWPRDTVYACDADYDLRATPEGSGVPVINNTSCSMTGFSLINEEFYSVDTPGCITILRFWRVRDWCSDRVWDIPSPQEIKVMDFETPALTCPDDFVRSVGDNCTLDLNGRIPPASATDNCDPDVEIRIAVQDVMGNILTDISNLPLGEYTVLYTADDGCGNDTTCQVALTVIDDVAPSAVCDSETNVSLDGNGGARICWQTIEDGSMDNCDIDSIRLSRDSVNFFECIDFNCDDIYGPVEGWMKVWDASGNTNMCDFTVNVADSIPPEIVRCADSISIRCWQDRSDTTLTGLPEATDNCDSLRFTFQDDDSGLDVCGLGEVIRTHTVTDGGGSTATCTQVITIEPTENVFVDFPRDTTVECLSRASQNSSGFPLIQNDSCNNYGFRIFRDDTLGTCIDGDYRIERDWLVEHNCIMDRFFRDTQIIMIIDTTPPVLVCPTDITIECSDDMSPSNTGAATATDNCDDAVSITFSDNRVDGPCEDEYLIERTFTAEDSCGNTSFCLQMIQVQDTTDPMISCPADVTIECSDDMSPSNTGAATATDNCDDDLSITFSDNRVDGICADEYVIERTWTAEDNCGNTSTCLQTIQVQDTTDPMISCPADVTIECSDDMSPGNTGAATATDNCDDDLSITFSDNRADGICADEYVIERTWTAEDNCGNTSTCLQTIQVQDTTDPMISCPADVTVDCDDDLTTSNTGEATATDNCDDDLSITFSDNRVDGVCADEYVIERTFTAEDNCGNTSTCLQNIQVQDTTPPVISGIMDQTVDEGEFVTLIAMATDNCAPEDSIDITNDAPVGNGMEDASGVYPVGDTDVIFTATDRCGNTSMDTVTITVVTMLMAATEDTTIFLESNLALTLNPEDFDRGSVGNNLSYFLDRTIIGCPHLGINDLLFIVENDSGRRDTAPLSLTLLPEGLPLTMRSSDLVLPESGEWEASPEALLEALPQICENNILWMITPERLDCNDVDRDVEFTVRMLNSNGEELTAVSRTLTLTDPAGHCQGSRTTAMIAGDIRTENGDGMPDVQVELMGQGSVAETDVEGHYELPQVPTGFSYTVTAKYDQGALNESLSTIDLVMIRRHILRLKKLDSPYKVVAADVNRSESVTTFDLALIRQAILRIIDEFPDVPAWDFIPASHQFDYPDHPFHHPIPREVFIDGLEFNQMEQDFVMIKMGDVTDMSNASPNQESRESQDPFQLSYVKNDKRNSIEICLEPRDISLFGMQFAIDLHKTGQQLRSAVGDLKGLTPSNIYFDQKSSQLRFSWDEAYGVRIDEKIKLLEIFFEDEHTLSECMPELSDADLKAEAYGTNNSLYRVELLPSGREMNNQKALILYQNKPNPVQGTTFIGFELGKEAPVQLEIFDTDGQLLYSDKRIFSNGYGEFKVRASDLMSEGVLLYRVSALDITLSKRMITIR